MVWYWLVSIIIYLMGASFSVGILIGNDEFSHEWLASLFIIFVWPVPLMIGLTQLLMDVKIFRRWWETTVKKLLDWNKNRKEDKLFYENHLDNKFERAGIKFDENDDVWRN